MTSILLSFQDLSLVYQLTSLVLSFGLIIVALEDLKTASIFSLDGLLSWNVSRLSWRCFCKGFLSKILGFLFSDRIFKKCLYLKLFFSIALFILSFFKIFSFFIFFPLFVLNSLIFIRSSYSLDGAYQMSLIILLALTIGSFFGVESFAGQLSIFFIAAQLTLAYFVSGFVKVISPVWRESSAMYAIFSTNLFGSPVVHKLLSYSKWIGYFAAWSVILFEVLFALNLCCHPGVGIGFLAIGAVFHLGNGVFMGLNNFIFSFIAAYPSFLFLLVKRPVLIEQIKGFFTYLLK